MDEQLKKNSFKGFAWRFLQNVSAQLISFIIQIVLARLLLPEDYGIIALTTVFITISNVFVQNGLTSGLVQKKEIDEVDKSSLFYISIAVGLVIYAAIFFLSPLFASFYETEELTNILRVQTIAVLFSAFSSVSIAIIQRELRFKRSFIVGVIGYIFQGAIGITLAYKGYGVWALVWGTLAYNVVYAIGNIIIGKWYPKFVFSFKRVKKLLAFSLNVLFSNLFSAIFTSIRSLIVGKAYSQESLGLYDKGNQFPIVLMNGFDGALSTVAYSTFSKIQDDKEHLLQYLRKTIKISMFVTVPLMFGLAAVAEPLILVLLTDKWAQCAPYMMVYCGICIFWPLSAKTHALNAIGKSRVTFITNIITIVLNIGLMLALVKCDLLIFAIGTLVGNFIGVIIVAVPTKKFLGYTYKDQIIDILPLLLLGGVMFGVVYTSSIFINLKSFVELLILVPMGAVIYLSLSYLFKVEGFVFIIGFIKKMFSRMKKNEQQ